MFKKLFGKGKGSGKTLPEPSDKLNPEADFQIGIPIIVNIPVSPIETFSERAVKALRTENIKMAKKFKGTIFQPMPNGKLRVYPPEGDGKRKN